MFWQFKSNLYITAPVSSGNSLLSSQFSKSRFFTHTNKVRRPPLLGGHGHPIAVLCTFVFLWYFQLEKASFRYTTSKPYFSFSASRMEWKKNKDTRKLEARQGIIFFCSTTTRKLGSCVLLTPTIECRSILAIDTSFDPRSTLDRHLGRPSIDISVGRLSIFIDTLWSGDRY